MAILPYDDTKQGWPLQVEAGVDRRTGRRRRRTKLVKAPNTTIGHQQAEIEHARLLLEVRESMPTSESTFREVAETWYERGVRRWSPKTADGYRRILDGRVGTRWGDVLVSEIRVPDLRRWHDSLFAAGDSPAVVNRNHAVLRAVLSEAVSDELIPGNPAAAKGMTHRETRQLEVPDPESVAKLFALADESDASWGAMVRVAALTGMRRGELCGLRWDAVELDEETPQLNVRLSVVQVGQRTWVKEPKTHRNRWIDLGPATVEVLRGQLARSCGEGFVWSDAPDGSQHLLPDSVSQRWRRLRDRAKLPTHVRLHDLRHFMASQLLADGEALPTVQQRLGHLVPSTTLNIYSHAIRQAGTRAASRIEELTLAGGEADADENDEKPDP